MNPASLTNRPALRKHLRTQRLALRPGEIRQAALQVTARVAVTPWLRAGARIGLYVSLPGELDSTPLRRLAVQRGCQVYLPRIINYRRRLMHFCRDYGVPLRPNRFGIGEPPSCARCAPQQMTVLFMPLLAFDVRGTRLGFGGGYYDRALAWRLEGSRHAAPLLIGLGYRWQQLPLLEPTSHDVPLDGVVTEDGIRMFQRGPHP